jgi:hypothetical protein
MGFEIYVIVCFLEIHRFSVGIIGSKVRSVSDRRYIDTEIRGVGGSTRTIPRDLNT